MGQFRRTFPQVSITLQIGDTRGISRAVAEGRAEVGVVGARPTLRGLDAVELMADELVVVTPPGHPWVGRAEISLDDLRREPLIVREPGSGSREALESALHKVGASLADVRVVAEIGSTSAVKQAVRAGVGISIISRRAVEEECRRGFLWCTALNGLDVTRSFYIVTHSARSRSPLCQAFVDFLIANRSAS